MIQEVAELVARITEIERRLAGIMRHGKVHEVDPEKATVRLDFGDGPAGGRFLSPSIPYAQVAGAAKWHSPPSVGQQMTLLAPSGDWRQAVAIPMTWSDAHPSPSQEGNEHVLTFGGWRITLKSDSLRLTNGGTDILAAATGITLKGDEIVTDGPTKLDRGTRQVHYAGGADTDGDLAVDAADRVFV